MSGTQIIYTCIIGIAVSVLLWLDETWLRVYSVAQKVYQQATPHWITQSAYRVTAGHNIVYQDTVLYDFYTQCLWFLRLSYPNVILIYISLSHILLMFLHLVGYTDEKALYCTSRDRVTSFEEGTAYCSIIGKVSTADTTITPSPQSCLTLVFSKEREGVVKPL